MIHDQIEVPARLRGYAEDRLARVGRHWSRILDTEVHFGKEKKGSLEPASVVRIVLRTDGRKHPLLKAQESAGDLQAAFDLALDKLDRQLLKLKGKVRENKASQRERPPGAADGELPATPPLERRRLHLRPQSVEEVEAELASRGDVFRVFLDEDSGQVQVAYRRRDGGLAIIEPQVS